MNSFGECSEKQVIQIPICYEKEFEYVRRYCMDFFIPIGQSKGSEDENLK
ncbi:MULTISPECIES: hypothetical protein [unclassified Peribacillus]|nr:MULTISPECIES: hypothetical protein [unclassified Peribacillus]MBK5442135.1 hypothetical protein [Peribacillus sp. TH24]MBK5463090.1 hypothetical protein [Peribacillus sp. TH27]MBK5501296.1 hypothetical protein [Peribacillus sp. TH14]WMX53732.1 hypothetical protein RE409_16725 [Peribacillus sp. R9-11]